MNLRLMRKVAVTELKPVRFTKEDVTPTLKRMGTVLALYPVTVLMSALVPILIVYVLTGSIMEKVSVISTILPVAYLVLLCNTFTLFVTPVIWNGMLFSHIFKSPVIHTLKAFNTTGRLRSRIMQVFTMPVAVIVIIIVIALLVSSFSSGDADESTSITASVGTMLGDIFIALVIGVFLSASYINDTVRFPLYGLASDDDVTAYIQRGVGDNFMLLIIHIGANTFLFFIADRMPYLVSLPLIFVTNAFGIAVWNHIFFSSIYPKVEVKQDVTVDDRDIVTDIG